MRSTRNMQHSDTRTRPLAGVGSLQRALHLVKSFGADPRPHVPKPRTRTGRNAYSVWPASALVLATAVALGAVAPQAHAQDPTKLAPEVVDPPAFKRGTNILGPRPKIDRTKPLYLQGDELIYDNKGNRITARGNVEIYFNNFSLTADEVSYDRRANTLTAVGNVELRDGNGGVTRGERITLSDDFKNGFIESLSVTAKDDTRITARRAIRRDGNVTEFEDGKFTPCKTKDGMPPLWCISARRVIHDQKNATISYEDASFEFMGATLFTLPYFQHPDPSVKRKSGFLVPEFSNSGDLGFMFSTPYHFALAPNYDFTFHPMYASRQGMLWQGDWRHKLTFGSITGLYTVKIAGIYQDYKTLPTENPDLDGWRGSIETKGRFSLSSWWQFGWNVTLESDDTFRRFYKLDNILRTDRVNTVYLRGLSERNHFSLVGYHFGGLLLDDSDVAKSKVHPVIDWNYIVGQPVLGGELSWNVNALSFSRDLAFVDALDTPRDVYSNMHRVAADVAWRRKLIDQIGITYTPFANLRGDVTAYDSVVDPLSNTLIESETALRGVASAGVLATYPWLATNSAGSHIVEPIGQLIVRTASISQSNLPNEDARSLVFDDTNLFDVSKFSGYDRIETGTRANVGLQYTFQSNSGPYARILAGQSFHLAGTNPYLADPGSEPSITPTEAPPLYSTDSGLSTSRSDYVIGAYLAPSTAFRLIGQARFDEQDLTLRRADIAGMANYGPFSLAAIYAYTTANPALDVLDQLDEQEITARLSIQLSAHWAATATLRYDIDANEARQTSAAISYSDDCFVLTATYIETLVEDPARALTPDQTVMFRFQLKHLGDFRYKTDILEHMSSNQQ
jgi:LPS-assembly protein